MSFPVGNRREKHWSTDLQSHFARVLLFICHSGFSQCCNSYSGFCLLPSSPIVISHLSSLPLTTPSFQESVKIYVVFHCEGVKVRILNFLLFTRFQFNKKAKLSIFYIYMKDKIQIQYFRCCSLSSSFKIQPCDYLTKKYIFNPLEKTYIAES